MTTRVKLLFVLVAGLWLHQSAALGAYPRNCAHRCTSTAQCDELCYGSQLDFFNGIEMTCLDFGICDPETCGQACTPGNGEPGSGEGGTCGDSQCNANEDCDSCPNDCAASEEVCGICGDWQCTANEYGGAGSGFPPQCHASATWCSYCGQDCGECSAGYCWPEVCGGEDERYQCRTCESTGECDYYGGWCATSGPQSPRDQLCHTFCWDDYECPHPWICDLSQNICIPPPA
jgi:hypothetical protein